MAIRLSCVSLVGDRPTSPAPQTLDDPGMTASDPSPKLSAVGMDAIWNALIHFVPVQCAYAPAQTPEWPS